MVAASLFEVFWNFNFRSDTPKIELGHFRSMVAGGEDRRFLPQLNVIHFEESSDAMTAVSLKLNKVSHLDMTAGMDSVVVCRQRCCEGDVNGCQEALTNLSKSLEETMEFWIIIDPRCPKIRSEFLDQVGYVSRWSEKSLDRWDASNVGPSSGPFATDRGLGVVRMLMIESLQNPSSNKRILWDPEKTLGTSVSSYISSLSPYVEIQMDSQTVYSNNATGLLGLLDGSTDQYDTSRILNEELDIWNGPGHLLEFGAYSMPPLWNIATILTNESEGLFNATEWGVLNFVRIETLFNCSSADYCQLTESGSRRIQNTFISVIRYWLGLPTDKCLGDCKEGSALSTTERILLGYTRRDELIQRMLDDSQRQINVLEALPRLRFPAEVSQMMHEAVATGIRALNEDNIVESVRLMKKASALSAEVLHHEAVTAPPSFAIEYIFALYGPIGLPVAFPVMAGLIEFWRSYRKNMREKVD